MYYSSGEEAILVVVIGSSRYLSVRVDEFMYAKGWMNLDSAVQYEVFNKRNCNNVRCNLIHHD